MKKITIIMMLVLTGMVAMAQTSIWNGKKTIWTNGAGTESDPYLIESADHLAFLAYVVNKGYNTSGMYFRLTTDIDLNGNEDLPWLPIGLGNRWFSEDGCDRVPRSFMYDFESRPYFSGHFDGGNHCISNIYVEDQGYAGLFGAAYSMSQEDTVVIENVFVVSGTIAGGSCGGIIGSGRSDRLVVSHCWNGAAINGNDAGGIVGSGSYKVIDCYNVGKVTGTGSAWVGGIVGSLQSNIIIEGCYNSGTIESGESGVAGGIVGYGAGNGRLTINNCYNTGAVSAMGGEEGNFPVAGGLVGIGRNSTITNSYNVGEVSCTNHLGCLIGITQGTPTVENAHYLNTCDQSEVGESQSEAFMRSQAFVDLLNSQNPEPVWALDVNKFNDGFPVLAGQVLSVRVSANPFEAGDVQGGGAYRFGTMATLTATANEGYAFLNWTNNGEEVSADPTYRFTVVGSDSYVANFRLNSYEVTVRANPPEGGTVRGAGSYPHGATATVTVTPKDGYQFDHWTKNGDEVSKESSYAFVVTEDCELVAHLISYGVDEENASVLRVYPNPSQGRFSVEGKGTVIVSNLFGQTVLTREIDGCVSMELPKGVYFVSLGHAVRKIVVD